MASVDFLMTVIPVGRLCLYSPVNECSIGGVDDMNGNRNFDFGVVKREIY